MIALLGYFFLQILQIIHADCGEMFVFVQSKQENAAAVLVGKAGKRITQFAWAAAMRSFYFNGLCFGLLCLYTFCNAPRTVGADSISTRGALPLLQTSRVAGEH